MSDEYEDDHSADGTAFQRVTKRYVATCPVSDVQIEPNPVVRFCPWKGKRNRTESFAWMEITGHLRRDHPDLELVTERTFRQTITWEPVEGTTAEEETR